MNLTWDELISVNGPSIFLVSARERDIDIFTKQAPKKENVIIRIIRGKNCQTKNELFNEFSSALQFPYYFGENWDAFNECITDLSWLKGDEYVLFISDSSMLVKKEDPEELKVFLQILTDAVEYWSKKLPFKIIFQTENNVDPRIESVAIKRELPPFDDIS